MCKKRIFLKIFLENRFILARVMQIPVSNVPLPPVEPSFGGSIKEQFYREKLVQLQSQLKDLFDENNLEYKEGLKKLQEQRIDRLDHIESVKALEIERINNDYNTELDLLQKELEDKKAELMSDFISDLEEKRQQIKHEYQNMDIVGDYVDIKPTSTRKLRRRPNEPLPRDDKRQRKSSPSMNYILSDVEINEDLAALGCPTMPVPVKSLEKVPSFCSGGGQSPARSSQTPVTIERMIVSVGDMDSYIESGKLFYDNKFYLRGQSVFVETSDMGKVAAIIQTISPSEVALKFLGENRRIFVNLWELRQGRAVLRKRNT